MDNRLMHYEFHRNQIQLDGTMAELPQKIAAAVEDTTDKAIVQAVIEAAQANGVTDLYLLDKTFIMDALREKQEREKPLTNADRIRAMVATDEGIAKILLSLDIYLAEDGREFTHLYCDGKNGCITEDDNIICTDEMRTACIQRWLQQPAKEE